MSRTIIHLDADAFFASVEQATDARLRGKPIAVGGEKRGIVASASYEARKLGIYTPMPTSMARRLCPKLIVLPGDFAKYEFFSRLMFSYAYDFTPDVEIGSIDEGYFDLTGARKPAPDIAQTIRRAIGQSLKLSVSEGVGASKLISQIASKLQKPAAFQVVPPGTERDFLSPLANKWLPGIGPKTSNQLKAAGLARIGQIAQTPADLLSLLVGNMAPQLRNFALGIDERPVVPARAPAKSYGEQETFAADTTDEPFLEATLRRMADRLMAKVREDGKSIRTLTVKVRYNDMDEDQANESLDEPIDIEREIYTNVSRLLRKAWKRRVSLRLVSLRLSNVYDQPFRSHLALDAESCCCAAQQRLAGAVDDLRRRFGRGVLLRGHDFVLIGTAAEVQSRQRKTSKPPSGPVSLTPRFSEVGATKKPDETVSTVSHAASKQQKPEEVPSPLSPVQQRSPQPSAYHRAIVQRQRLGHYVSRQPPDPKARRIVSPGPALQFRNQPSPGPVRVSAFAHPRRSAATFIPLNVHSNFSFLDSTLSVKAIIELAKRHDLPAIALTDRNNLHGAVEFAQAAAAAGLKPIIGAEVVWEGQRVCVYVQNQAGYHNLCKILNVVNGVERAIPPPGEFAASLAKTAKARCESSWSQRPTEGLIAVSATPELAQFFPDRFYLEVTGPSSMTKTAPNFKTSNIDDRSDRLDRTDLTDRSNYGGGNTLAATALISMAVPPSPPLPGVASLPIHYASPADRIKYDIVQSIRTLTLLRQAHPEKRLDGQYHFRSGTDMQKLFGGHPELLRHSLEIADRCSFEFKLGKPQFPGYSPPDELTPAQFLRRLVMEGLRRRYPKKHAQLQPQVELELSIITDVGYEEYFLIMWDILQECRRRGIEWITRGSAADSLACYCLEISNVCPIRFDLYFRRFLNKERMALNKLPDIDVDFPHDRKDDVVDLVFEKFGAANTAIVGGFSTFQSRSAFAEVAKVLGVSEFQVRRLTEHLPQFARASELPEAVAESQECRDLPFLEEPYRTALQMAHFLDGFPRYPKMHPCGLVLSRQAMDEIVPCFISAKGYPTTHFDMDSIEAVGLIKMDILAQGGLAVMRDVEEMLAAREMRSDTQERTAAGAEPNRSAFEPGLRSGVADSQTSGARGNSASRQPRRPFDLAALEPWEDPAVWQIIASGNARAVHHIESPAMISLCKMCNVQDIDTLVAIVSVIRPGAANESKKMEFARRYQGLSPVQYVHPSLEPCLRSTFGLVVYEEHILQICEAFAGLPPGRADVLRRALGKDRQDIIDEIEIEFAGCARKLGRSESEIAEVWELVVGFKGYAFCKAHSTAYGVEAYQSAWLKLHYPAEFMAAVLTNGKGFYSPLVYVLECHRLGIRLLPPSVNDPGPQFAVMDVPNSERALNAPLQLHDYNCTRGALINTTQTIRVPVLNIKGLTQRTKDAILAERRRGEFTSLHDFFTRVQPLNEEMERLIQAGAFDLFGKPRTTQYWQFRALLRTPPWNIQNPESRVAPPRQLWLLPPENLELERRLPSVPLDEPERLQCLRWEEELFGYPVSGHPLELYPNIAWDTYCPVNRLDEHIGEQIVTCGLVIEQRLFHQVTGEPMKFITIADWTGIVETELFARTYKSYGLATVRYPVLEITATVEPFENGRGFTLRVLRAAKPRMKTSPNLSRDGVRRR